MTKTFSLFFVFLFIFFSCSESDDSDSSAESKESSSEQGELITVSGKVIADDASSLSSSSLINTAASNSGVPNATIVVSSDTAVYNTTSDSEGSFSINVEKNDYKLIISKKNGSDTNFWYKSDLNLTTVSLSSYNFSQVFLSKHATLEKKLLNNENKSTGTFKAGDVATFKIIASDPNDLPLQYKFSRMRNNSLDSVLQNWSSSNELSYTFLEDDAVNGFSISIGVKNNDGTDADSSFSGDVQGSFNLTVNSALSPSKIDSLEIYQNGSKTTKTTFDAGETVEFKILASDENSLPIQYIFRRYRNNTVESTLQNWSSTNTFEYTFLEDDSVTGFSIGVGVKNNDGKDAEGSFSGDAQGSFNLTVNSQFKPAAINSLQVLVSDVVTLTRNFSVGDTVKIKINATDPNDLPIQYIFRRYRNNSLNSTLQNWSSSSELIYTFLAGDEVNGFSIGVGVKNNDGKDAGGSFTGDAQDSVSFNINSL